MLTRKVFEARVAVGSGGRTQTKTNSMEQRWWTADDATLPTTVITDSSFRLYFGSKWVGLAPNRRVHEGGSWMDDELGDNLPAVMIDGEEVFGSGLPLPT